MYRILEKTAMDNVKKRQAGQDSVLLLRNNSIKSSEERYRNDLQTIKNDYKKGKNEIYSDANSSNVDAQLRAIDSILSVNSDQYPLDTN